MSSTAVKVGLDESGKNSSKVLKPPGGGTSDIFTSSIDETDKRIASNQENGIEKTGNESEKLFSNHESGEGIVEDKIEGKKMDNKSAFVPASSIVRNCVTGEGCQTQEHYAIRVVPQREGNPVTGEGYDDPKSQHSAPAPIKNRIPPGGYSSGLW